MTCMTNNIFLEKFQNYNIKLHFFRYNSFLLLFRQTAIQFLSHLYNYGSILRLVVFTQKFLPSPKSYKIKFRYIYSIYESKSSQQLNFEFVFFFFSSIFVSNLANYFHKINYHIQSNAKQNKYMQQICTNSSIEVAYWLSYL